VRGLRESLKRLEPGWTRRSRPLPGVRLLRGPGGINVLEPLLALSPLLARVLLLSVVMLPALPRSMRAGIRYCVCAGSSFESGKDKIVEEEGRLHDVLWGFAVLGRIADDRAGNVEHVEEWNGRGMKPMAMAIGWRGTCWLMASMLSKASQSDARSSSTALGPIGIWGVIIQEERNPGRYVVNGCFDRVAYIVLDDELQKSWMSPIVQSGSKMVWGLPYDVSPLRPVGVSVSLCIDMNVFTLRRWSEKI
jgi:hypothetical protein